MPRFASTLAVSLSLSLFAPAALAEVTCSTCEDCTVALAQPDVEVQLTGDLALHGAGPCITLRGDGARFNGMNHVILAQPQGGTAVRVEGANEVVRNLRVTGAEVSVHLASARDATVYNVISEARGVGFKVESSPGARLDRVRSSGGRVGVSFGAADDASCPVALPMRSPGAVVLRSTIERATTGLAACDARPVLTGNTFSRNGVGLLLGEPAAGTGNGGFAPYDACVCAPGVEGLRPGMLAMYSSGCASCAMHEGWLPSLRRRGVEVRVRESGPGHEEAGRRFDRYGWHCMPGVMDSLGIPGCVPNYACVASGAFSKRREGERNLTVEVPIDNEEGVVNFARECAGAATGRYARGGARCVTLGVVDNTVCGNRTMDIRAVGNIARWGGTRNRCGRVEGWTDNSFTSCAQGCEGAAVPPPLADLAPPPPTPAAPEAMPPAPAATPPTTARAPTPPSTTATPPSSNDEPLYLVAGMVIAAVAGAWFFRKRS